MLTYQKYAMYRGKETHLKDLKPNSKKKIKITCPWCGVSFERYFFRLQQSGSFLCQKCAIADNLSTVLEVDSKNNNLTVLGISELSGRSICRCDCGGITEVFNKDFLSGRVKSCGCLRSENMKRIGVHLRDHEHGNWKGGISSERQKLMAQKIYKDWKLSVFKRDNFTCLKCGLKDNNLNTHHLANYEDNKEQALDLENGVTLCGECHRAFHAEYGRKNNTKDQFDKFMSNGEVK